MAKARPAEGELGSMTRTVAERVIYEANLGAEDTKIARMYYIERMPQIEIAEDGAVDVDTLKEAAMEQVKKQGFAEIGGIPIIKKITFRAEDVEKLYHYIVEG